MIPCGEYAFLYYFFYFSSIIVDKLYIHKSGEPTQKPTLLSLSLVACMAKNTQKPDFDCLLLSQGAV